MTEHRENTERLISNALMKAINGGALDTDRPTPDETDVQHERLRSLVNNVTLNSLNEIGALREECSELIRTVHDRQEHLLQQISNYVTLAKSLVESKKIMGDALAGINEQFKSLPLAPTLNGKATH